MENGDFGLEEQELYMNKLADFVIDAADNCEDIRDWLRVHRDFQTPKLLADIDSAESDETELSNEK